VNLILEKTDQVPYFTNMRLVLQALGVFANDYDWYVSDIEMDYSGTELSSDDQWISGEELQQFLERNEVQFIWAVFSAFPKDFRCAVQPAPYADGNSNYWNSREVFPQLEGALFEVTCWDSSATILVGLSAVAETAFMQTYSDACPLVKAATKQTAKLNFPRD
jgi:hypothetical protein